jgi:hypothetical protein
MSCIISNYFVLDPSPNDASHFISIQFYYRILDEDFPSGISLRKDTVPMESLQHFFGNDGDPHQPFIGLFLAIESHCRKACVLGQQMDPSISKVQHNTME